jgi:putative cell wall-binding protein
MRISASGRFTVAAVAVVGVVLSWSPVAQAFGVPSAASLIAGVQETFSAGVTAQPANDVTVNFADNATTSVWSSGDRLTFQLWDSTINGPLSNTASNTLHTANFVGQPEVSATNGVTSSSYAVGLAQSATSPVDDEFTLTFDQDAPKDTQVGSFIISGLSISLGSQAPLGRVVSLEATSNNGTPFAGASATALAPLGTIPSATVSNSQVVTGAPGATGVSLGNVVLTDTAGGAVSNGDEIDMTLAYGAYFTTAGTVGGSLVPLGSPTIVTVTSSSDTVETTVTKTSVAGDTVTYGGAKVTLPSTYGEVYLAISDKTKGSFLGAVGVATVATQTRIGGADRYATATALFDPQFSSSTSVVLTSGENYPDALSAGYLAKQLNTGVLTTDAGSLSPETRQELVAHYISTVYLVGGTAAVSQNVQNQVTALHVNNTPTNPLITVVRIAGGDRFATNSMVDTYHLPSVSTTAIVATGDNFADALAVGPAIYQTGDPLILTDGQALSPSATTTITDLGIHSVIIVGGTNAVSTAVESALTADGVAVKYRIAGADRTQTAADLATWETTGLAAVGSYAALGGLGFSDVGLVSVARGDNFADALSAGPVAGAEQHVILLAADPNTVGPGIGQFLAGRAGTVTTLQALGLSGAITVATLNAAAETLTKALII